MTPQIAIFRASIISPITWSLLIPVVGSWVVALICLPACFVPLE